RLVFLPAGYLRVETRAPRAASGLLSAHAVVSFGSGAPNPSDDAVLMQGRDCGSVEAEPIGKHRGSVLAEQRSRLDFGRDPIEAHRPSGHRHLALPMRHRLQDPALVEARLVDQLL